MKNSFIASAFLIALTLLGCQNSSTTEEQTVEAKPTTATKKASSASMPSPLFKLKSAKESGIEFKNMIMENEFANYIQYEYFYNGGGVAIGDLNNDGLKDLFFTGNMVANRLYKNNGSLQFEDLTEKANLNLPPDWCTGANMVDINNDGLLDIYISRSGWFKEVSRRRNLLYINKGDFNFVESAAEYGIDDPGYSTQAVFFDYDRDGDLDMYQANHPNDFLIPLGVLQERMIRPAYDTRDRLYRNDGDKFTDVSTQAGIVNHAHGLGVTTADFDGDGWQDIYVANDYVEHDYMYRNNHDGTFTDIAETALRHGSNTSMGVDIADINNDGLDDIFVLDMLAEDNFRQKTNMPPMNPKLFWTFVKYGFQFQYMRNSLQLNYGEAAFGEIGQMANVWNTDWSWAALFADYDNDGFKDLFVTNGYKRDVLHKDHQKMISELQQNKGTQNFKGFDQILPASKLTNYIFQNQKDLTFKKRTSSWGFGKAMNSNGAAYADLDNDGDLDLIINNIDEESVLYENRTNDAGQVRRNFLQVKLEGKGKNMEAIGASIVLKASEHQQRVNIQPTRGYQSRCMPEAHFGLGQIDKVDQLIVTWPDGKQQTVNQPEINQRLVVQYENAIEPNKEAKQSLLAEDVTDQSGIGFQHKEKEFDDYEREVLLPHQYSQIGPALAVADLNNDGFEDFYIGGAHTYEGAVYLQQSAGKFKQIAQDWANDRMHEDVDATFFDADGDGDQDLYVVSGSNEFEIGAKLYQDRLYLNDGTGSFKKSKNALPQNLTSGGCVRAADYDQDGDIDLFVGGKLVPGLYPNPATSVLLENNEGTFKDVTEEKAQALVSLGMVSDAVWSDFDGDQDLDLVIAGEWMSPTFMKNEGGRFINANETSGIHTKTGWFTSVAQTDIDDDGDIDYIFGNLGLNSKNKASEMEPFHVYASDFDGNGTNDIVLGYYNQGVCYPVRGRQCSSEQVPSIKQKFKSYDAFGRASLEEVYTNEALGAALHRQATEFRTGVAVNKGKGRFVFKPLPNFAQIAPTFAVIPIDLNADGGTDLLTFGNQFRVEVETGRYDAHPGIALMNNSGKFEALFPRQTGMRLTGDCRKAARIQAKNGQQFILVARNDEAPILLKLNPFESKKSTLAALNP